jgi:hypothetical protein
MVDPYFRMSPSHAPTEGEAREAGVRNDAGRDREASSASRRLPTPSTPGGSARV